MTTPSKNMEKITTTHIKMKLNNLINEIETHINKIILSNYTGKNYFELDLTSNEVLEIHIVNNQVKWLYLRNKSKPAKAMMWEKIPLQKKVEILDNLLQYDKS